MLPAGRTGAKVLAAALSALALSGCAGTSSVSEALTAGALQKSRAGVALLKAQILGHGCNGGSITLGVRKGAVYEVAQTLQTATGAAATGNDIMQVELQPNEYHVINVSCGYQSGRTVTSISLGKTEGGSIFGYGGQYKRSFASFRIETGEILNVGSLTIMSTALGTAHLSVTDLPAASLERLRKDKPNLTKHMNTRLMTIVRVPRSPEETKKMCDTYEQLKTALPALAASMPAECTGSAAAPATADAKKN